MNLPNSSSKNKNLSDEENEAVFLLLGDGCQSQCTTIAEVYETTRDRWAKKHTGVLCFIKDNNKRSYFCRMYCLILHQLVWEQEIYNELVMEKVRPFLLEFEGDKRMIALSFCFEDEASNFMNIVMSTIANRNRRREERQKMGHKPPPPPKPTSKIQDENKNPEKPSKVKKKSKKDSKKGKKFSKEDIGKPSNFIHITHMGPGGIPDFGTEEIKTFFGIAGFTEDKLRDPEIKKHAENFIRENNRTIEQVIRRESMMPQKNINRPAPPPPKTLPPELPHRDLNTLGRKNRELPPVPKGTPPVIRKAPVASSGPPPPPIPANFGSPLPPPIPPTFTNAPPPPGIPTTNAQKPNPIPIAKDPMSELLESIRKRQGTEGLKKVSEIDKTAEKKPIIPKTSEDNQTSGQPTSDDLAKAFNTYLEKRAGAVRDSSDSEDESDGNRSGYDTEDWE